MVIYTCTPQSTNNARKGYPTCNECSAGFVPKETSLTGYFAVLFVFLSAHNARQCSKFVFQRIKLLDDKCLDILVCSSIALHFCSSFVFQLTQYHKNTISNTGRLAKTTSNKNTTYYNFYISGIERVRFFDHSVQPQL